MTNTIDVAKTSASSAMPPLDSRSLWAAIQSGRPPRAFGEFSASVASERNIDGRNALMWACYLGKFEWAGELKRISDLTAKDSCGRSALMWAAYGNVGTHFTTLMPTEESLFEVDAEGQTALAIAIKHESSYSIIDLLRSTPVTMRARISAKTFAAAFDVTPCAVSDYSGEWQMHIDVIRRRIEALPATGRFERGQTPLHLAARHGLLDVVERMLAEGADPGALDDLLRTPLMTLAERGRRSSVGSGRLAVARLLISVSDPMWADHMGKTALMFAAEVDDVDLARLLLPVSAPNARMLHDYRDAYFLARQAAIKHGTEDKLDGCLALLAPVTRSRRVAQRQDVQGNAFRAAASRGELKKILAMLAGEAKRGKIGRSYLPLGGNIDRFGEDALMVAAQYGKTECIDTLAQCCDPYARNNRRETALMMAVWRGAIDCVRKLLPISHADARDANGNTALMIAAERGNSAAIRLLIARCL